MSSPLKTKERPLWLPPGQIATGKFPVVGERKASRCFHDLSKWSLQIEGLCAFPFALSWKEIQAYPEQNITQDIHCVTGWSHTQMQFSGFPLRQLLQQAKPLSEAQFVRFIAYSERNHDTTLPLELALKDVWLVRTFQGKPLLPEHGYPLRSLCPSRYFYKSVKWLHKIEFLAEDQLGYWEQSSNYHNDARPWKEERYQGGSMSPKQLEKFKSATSFEWYRKHKKIVLHADLNGWKPKSSDLSGLQIKNSDLRAADLSHCNLKGANLTRCDLRGASLLGSNLEDADLEGVNFAGADLRESKFIHCYLSATQFFTKKPDGTQLEARVEGMKLKAPSGLLEEQEKFLHRSKGD